VGERDVSADEIAYQGLALVRRAKPQRPPRTGFESTVAAEAVVSRRRQSLHPLVDHRSRAVAVVRLAGGDQSGRRVLVQREAVRLVVGTFVPRDAEPL